MSTDLRQDFPATQRNREAIALVLERLLTGEPISVLEIASGSGQHAAYFASRFPEVRWQPSDLEQEHCQSVDSWCRDFENVPNCLQLDVLDDSWPPLDADIIFCANMIHIAPAEATAALLKHGGRILKSGGRLCLYGPFIFSDRPLEESNAKFDQSLRERNPSWGLRQVDTIIALAKENGLQLVEEIKMPANNYCLLFSKTA